MKEIEKIIREHEERENKNRQVEENFNMNSMPEVSLTIKNLQHQVDTVLGHYGSKFGEVLKQLIDKAVIDYNLEYMVERHVDSYFQHKIASIVRDIVFGEVKEEEISLATKMVIEKLKEAMNTKEKTNE